MTQTIFTAALILFACAPAPTPDPSRGAMTGEQPMTVEQHKQEAVVEEAKAKDFQERSVQQTGNEMGAGGTANQSRAITHEKKADQHRKAAQALETKAAIECNNVNPQSYCPLEDPNIRKEVVSTPRGIKFVINSTPLGGIQDVNAQIRCHIAYARAHSVQDTSCPLYMKGIETTVSGTNQSTVILLESPNPKDAMLLQAWSASVQKNEPRK